MQTRAPITPPDLSRIERLCVERGLKMTGQRRLIARVLSAATDHPDVDELHRRAHQVDPHISIVIPTQRRPGPLLLAARSAIAQTGVEPGRLELVIVDNDTVPSARENAAIL